MLKTLRFSETSVIAHIYTAQFGRQAYIINGVHAPKSKFKAALLQVLTPLEMVVYHREQKNLQRLSEIRPAKLLTSIPFEVVKSSLAIFMSEILYRSLQEAEANEPLFQFLSDAIYYLDDTRQSVAGLPVLFLLQLSRFLGFFPNDNFFYTERAIFDLTEGVFVHRLPTHPHHLRLPLSEIFAKAIPLPLTAAADWTVGREQRKALLAAMLKYYELHIEGFGELKSVKILEEILA